MLLLFESYALIAHNACECIKKRKGEINGEHRDGKKTREE